MEVDNGALEDFPLQADTNRAFSTATLVSESVGIGQNHLF